MELSRIKYLQGEADAEALDLEEVAEIEAAFALIPNEELRDLRENALADDMLEELEALVTPMEKAIYEFVREHYGESEANDPSWAIGPLADHLNKVRS